MDNRDTCSLKDKRKMDANKVWQWRIMRAKKYSRCPEPFYHCNRIGLDFNVASSAKKNLDLQLVTNGVILEVCDFAKTVNKSKTSFIINILENNFDLGLENEQQRIDFSARILHKVKDLIRKPYEDKNDVFTLFDTSKTEFNNNDGLNMASTELTESLPVEMDDSDDSEHEDEFECSQATSKEHPKTERLSVELAGAHGDDSEHEDEFKCSEAQSAEELTEDVLPLSFPCCEEIGLCLDVGSKQSLDPGLLTRGVMLELVHFTGILSASYSAIVLGVLEHNFELDLKSQQGKNRVWFKILQLLKRRKGHISPEFKDEQFSFHTKTFKRTRDSALSDMEAPQYQFKEVTKRRQSDLNCKQEKRALLTTSERAYKMCRKEQSKDMEINTLSHHTDLPTSHTAEGDHCHTCPQGESDLASNTGNKCDMEQEEMEMETNHIHPLGESDLGLDKVTNSGNSGNRDHLVSSSLPTVNSDVHPPFASQPDESGLGGGKEQTQTPRHSPNKYDMDQEEMRSKNMWKLRANRVKHILSAPEFGPFSRPKHMGLEFNVGFGPKQNISIDSLSNCALLKVAKFALAMNSSQQNFIMEILEYNFDFCLQSEYQRNVLPCEIMNRVRQLKECEDAVKFSKKVFELPGSMPSTNITNLSMGSVKEECDDVPVCPPHSHTETEEHISQKSEDLYPFCKEIGLKLHVNNSRPNKKLDINKLTNGAMTEVTNFAEKLCGTFEQICLDILGHNFDLDLQSGDSDVARNILARIPAIMDQKNLKACINTRRRIHQTRKHYSTKAKLDGQSNPNLDVCSSSSSQATIIAQDVSSSADIEHQNELNLKLWKLRANHIQHILSIPHEEHCPLYSYTRCKKLGIDFNVGSGVKQNLDPKLLTNGIMVEVNAFATALQLAHKYFITEILEYNFHVHFKNELHRSAFAQQIMDKVKVMNGNKKDLIARMKLLFELPDTKCIQEPTHDRTAYCPKCYQDRNHKLHHDESDPGHMDHPRPHAMTDAVSADANCTAQKPAMDPSSTFSTIEKTIMNSYPLCEKIGLNLCVDKDQPKDKLDMHVLTRGVMNEVAYFAKKLCGTKSQILNDVIEHNFNITLLGREVSPTTLFNSLARKDVREDWFSDVFVFPQIHHRQDGLKRAVATQSSEWKETIKKRKLALQTKEKRATLPSQNTCVIKKSKTNKRGRNPVNCFPTCTEIGLDLDVTSKSREKKKLDLKLLTRAVVFEIYKFVTKKTRQYLAHAVYEILDYNFDLSSQHHRRWEFSLATAFKVQAMVKHYQKHPDKTDKVFTLPFMFERRQNQKNANSSLNIASSYPSYPVTCVPFFTSTHVSSSKPAVNSNVSPPFASQPEERGEKKITDSGNTGSQDQLQNPSSDIPRESESSYLGVCAPFHNTTDISSSLPTVNSNVNPPFASQTDECGLDGGEEQTQTPGHSPNECDMDHEEMGKESNMWKLRANRVKQILSASEFGPFSRSKSMGLEFNVGFGPKQNISIDFLKNSALLEVAKFALAMNSSQPNFIMEILENNFDISLQTEHQRDISICEIMNRVRQLKECEDTVKFSKEVFELPGFKPSINFTHSSMGSFKEECDDVPVCPPHSHAETEEHISQKNVDLFSFCKEIGLRLNVNKRQPNKKLDINKLTNGAMTEVTNFAEKLCGTFEQICLDILGHNFDLDLQSGDSDVARDILARIPAIVDQKNLSNCAITEGRLKGPKMVELDCQNNPNEGACSAHFSPAAIIHQDVSSPTDIEYQNEDNLNLWQLRANHIQQILSIPHDEHCPFYPYSRCKKLGIDFNVGFGVKQNHDPKLLTNGIMVELNTFATALLSAQRYFITDILECNFDLDLKNELFRSAYAQQTFYKVQVLNARKKYSKPRINNPFELPDMRYVQKSTTYCPKCYQNRNRKLHRNESDPCHMHHPCPHTMTNAVSADTNCTAQKPAMDPSSTFSATEETLMDSYPRCKKIGLKLCVDKDQRKDKLDMSLLTRGVMNEVASFTKKLCGTKLKIVNDVLEHNFNIGMQGREVSPAALFQRVTKPNNVRRAAWFSEVFVIQQYTRRAHGYVSKVKRAAAMHQSEWKEALKKRQLALQAKEERATLSSHNISIGKSKTNPQSKGNCFPIFKGIGLDQDITSECEKKEKLDKLLTRAACDIKQEEEIRAENYYTCPLGESDLDSDEVTDLEDGGNQDQLQSPKHSSPSSDIPRESESSYLGVCAPFLTTTDVSSSLPTVNSNVNPPFASQPDERGLVGGEEQTQTPGNASNECDMDQEEMGTENNMWKLRANRVNQILSAVEFGPFHWCKNNSFEFNVGFGPKQNISVDSLPNSALFEIAKFALAMNSSQQNFIMEILEYNFDFCPQSQYQGNVLPCEIMNRVRQLKECEDAVKFSKEVFELPGFMPSIYITNLSMGSVKEECDDVPVCPPHSHTETKEHISQKSEDLYPFCKDIGLKLHVNNSRPNKKLDINKLTNGAMTEVTNFAEELCGTFEQICLDVLRHNLDLDSQSGDSDFARSIVAQIPTVMEQRSLRSCVKVRKKLKGPRKDSSTKVELDCQNNPNLDACISSSSQAAIIAQDVSNSPDIEHQNELDLKLWKLRANHIQHILSIPHEEHCPLYSYTRCKKSGIHFNVGFGVKQNLDPKLLTNGIMVELNAFATALLSAQKYFITEILEYNFDLDFNDELHRCAFAQEIMEKVKTKVMPKRSSCFRMKMLFELPDTSCIQELTRDRTAYCPKCYQDRNHKLHQDESDPGHMDHPRIHTMTDAASADTNCTAQKPAMDPSSTLSATEETLMDSYPLCKKIGLKLCVDKDQPKDKLEMHVLTRGVMNEVARFAKRLCGTKTKIIHTVLEHNFNIGILGRDIDFAQLFRRATMLNNGELDWFNEVFEFESFQTVSHRQPGHVSKMKQAAAMHGSERKETIKKRQLALQAKEERAALPSHNKSVEKKSKTNPKNCYPICTEIGLDLDVTPEMREKEKLDLKLLTRAVVYEIYKFVAKKTRQYLPNTVYDILDYNFDLSSQHHRRWEFSIATASKVQTMVKHYQKHPDKTDKVFKLPFEFDHKDSQSFAEERQTKKHSKYSREEPVKKTSKGHFVRQVKYRSDGNHVHFLDGVRTNEEIWCHDEDTKFPTDPGMMVQMNGNLLPVGSGSLFQGNLQIKEDEYDPRFGNMTAEPDTEGKNHPYYNVKTESNTEGVKHLVPDEPTGPLGYNLWQNSERGKTQSANESVRYYIVTEPQGSAVCPNTASNIKTEQDTENVIIPVQAARSEEYSVVIIGQGDEST